MPRTQWVDVLVFQDVVAGIDVLASGLRMDRDELLGLLMAGAVGGGWDVLRAVLDAGAEHEARMGVRPARVSG